MFANARMYSVVPSVGMLWRRLLGSIAERAGRKIDIIDWPAPLPLDELWDRPDKAAVFMCGLPFSLARPQPEPVAAPVPTLPRSGGQPAYWSELVVNADSAFCHVSETFGRRIAFTEPNSQSGYAAPLHYMMQLARDRPLYREVIAPCMTPFRALMAVVERQAEIAAIDSWAFALMQRHAPDVVARVRVVARTEPTPIPLLTASTDQGQHLTEAFLTAHDDPAIRSVMEKLLIGHFVQPQAESYVILKQRFEIAQEFWRQQPFAEIIDPAFALMSDSRR